MGVGRAGGWGWGSAAAMQGVRVSACAWGWLCVSCVRACERERACACACACVLTRRAGRGPVLGEMAQGQGWTGRAGARDELETHRLGEWGGVEDGRGAQVGGEGQGGEAEEGEGEESDAEAAVAQVQVSFSVFVDEGSPLAPGEAVYVCGNVAELGSWRPEVRLVFF